MGSSHTCSGDGMKFHKVIIIIYAICLVMLVVHGSNVAFPGEVYWKSQLPNTPIPKALQELLRPFGNKSNFSEVHLMAAPSGRDKADYEIGYGNVDRHPEHNQTTTYFSYNDLHPDKKMKLAFTKAINDSKFLPRKTAETIPFSTHKLERILNYFSIDPTSEEAQIIKQTVQRCAAPGIRGEDKCCATSLESLVDFIVSKLGRKVYAVSNEAEEENRMQDFTILNGVKMIGDSQIVCHKLRYKYAVFYCHRLSDTKAYMVPLTSEYGSKAKAVVVCHFDTSAWNPEHMAFHVLNVKPGGSPICHFLNSDAIVWVSI